MFSNLSTLSVPDEGCSRDASCALNWIYIRFYQETTVVIPLIGSTRRICVPVPSHDLYLQRHMSWSLCIHWDNKRGDCSFCWYLWNWWPSLYNFHNNTSTYRPATTLCIHVTVDINDIWIIWIYSIGATGTPNWNIAAISRIYCSELL